jgi:coenzyme F420-0:L-glutamate ligase / coenzyme F420-1:gamma-L-glutamate ligase
VQLATVEPSPRALELARIADKDPRLVELMLGESREVLRAKTGVLILEHRLGFVMANAGIDQSNVPGSDGEEIALLLPSDPTNPHDAYARVCVARAAATSASSSTTVLGVRGATA